VVFNWTGQLLSTSSDGTLLFLLTNSSVFAMDLRNGLLVWTVTFPSVPAGYYWSVVNDDWLFIYYPTSGNIGSLVIGYSIGFGGRNIPSLLWNQNLNYSLLITDGTTVLTDSGTLVLIGYTNPFNAYLLAFNGKTGSLSISPSLGTVTLVSMSFSEKAQTVFLMARFVGIYAYAIANWQQLWFLRNSPYDLEHFVVMDNFTSVIFGATVYNPGSNQPFLIQSVNIYTGAINWSFAPRTAQDIPFMKYIAAQPDAVLVSATGAFYALVPDTGLVLSFGNKAWTETIISGAGMMLTGYYWNSPPPLNNLYSYTIWAKS